MNLYKKFLGSMLFNKAKITDFHSFSFEPGEVLLRHDIDFSLSDALDMARIEHSLGIKSTYFVMLDSPFYSILDSEGKAYIAQIQSLGHEIGIHFDPINSICMEDDLQVYIDIFKRLLNINIQVISFHRPGEVLNKNITFDFVKHAYEMRYFNRKRYLSDSSGRIDRVLNYNFGDLKECGMQLLIHPIWWNFNDIESFSVREVFRRFLSVRNKYTQEMSQRNCEAFNEY